MSEQVKVSIEYPNGFTDNAALVTPLGGGRFRLELDPISSMFAETEDELRELPNFGDTIEAEALKAGALRYVKVVERAKLRRLELILTRVVAESTRLREILTKVKAEGGHWELVFGGVLIVCVPEASSYDPAKDIEDLVRGT